MQPHSLLTPHPSPPTNSAAAPARRFFRLQREHGLLLLFLAVFLYFSLTTPGFFTKENLLRVLQVQAPVGALAVGMTLVILTGGIDLSVGSAAALAGVVLGVTWRATGNSLLALLAGLGAGAVCGLFNGLLISRGRVPALIVTLATLSVFRGLAFAVGGSETIGKFGPAVLGLSQDLFLLVPVPIWITLALMAGAGIYLSRTDGGRAVYAVGSNEAASRLAGVPTALLKLRIYLLSGFLAGLAACLYAGLYDTIRADIGREYELAAITMVVLGGTSVTGGEGSIAGTSLGFLLLITLQKGIELNPKWRSESYPIVVAVLLIGALLLDAGFRKRLRGM